MTCTIANLGAGADTVKATVKCLWTPTGTGSGAGPPDIMGLADGTATRSGNNVSWYFTPIVQRADGTSAINWYVEVNDAAGNPDPSASIISVSACPPADTIWVVTPPLATPGTGPQLAGSASSSTPSTGFLKVTFSDPIESPNTSSTMLIFFEATLTIYVDCCGGSSGHAWWRLSFSPAHVVGSVVNDPLGQYANKNFGFWPLGPIFGKGKLLAGYQQHKETAKCTWPCTLSQFIAGLVYTRKLKLHPPAYNFLTHNCTHEAINLAGATGLVIPNYTVPSNLDNWLKKNCPNP